MRDFLDLKKMEKSLLMVKDYQGLLFVFHLCQQIVNQPYDV